MLVLMNPSIGDVLIGAFYMDFVLDDLILSTAVIQETNNIMPCLAGLIG